MTTNMDNDKSVFDLNDINMIVFHYPCQDGLSSVWVGYHYYNINNLS